MRVKVLFLGPLREMAGVSEQTIDCMPGETLGALFERYPKIAGLRASIALARNREFAPLSTSLAEGDEVAFLPPVSGGTDDDVVEIVDSPIDVRAIVVRLQRGEDGAVVTFEGITRNNSKGRSTRYLEYEAYRPMAIEQMRVIVREAKAQFQIDRIGIIHRLGRLEIGEASVVIVVTSAHRAAAFDACRFAIDKLKKSVPIWKKEFFADGEVWVEGEVIQSQL
jgi:molybdopterin synthase catalytic subunit/molybdopterin converting factor small subunit